jgi:hypothetical protein
MILHRSQRGLTDACTFISPGLQLSALNHELPPRQSLADR